MNSKKNIAIVIDSLGGGGAERVMLNLAKGLLQAGHYVHVFCLESRRDYEVSDDIPISVLYSDRSLKKIAKGRYLKPSALALEKLVASIEALNGNFNLFLSNLDPTNAVVAQCSFENVHYILHNAMKHELARERRLGPFKYWRKLKSKKIMDQKNLIAVSQGVTDEARELGVISPCSIVTIYNPVDVESVKALSKNHEPSIPSEPFILHVGRVVKAKRHDVLLKALSLVPEIKLVLLCKDVEKAKKIAKKYGVLDRVILPGFTVNPYSWMAQAQLTVISSDYEGLCMALVESLICGTPVVSTDCDYGPSEILTGDMAKFLSPCGDSSALAENIRKALCAPLQVTDAPILQEVTMEKAVEQYIALAN
jgi:glycosyltransferase involved in cell wall biosynthesis